ncbi:MAG: hypothetical protein ACRDTG_33185 [Pseudonocardiaceae bacterium]
MTLLATPDLFAPLTGRMSRIERHGDTYTLHHSMIHSVTARTVKPSP